LASCPKLVLAAALTPLFAASAALLVVAGVAKLRAAGRDRALGVAELALGAAALANPTAPVAALVACAYAAFAGHVIRLLATGDRAPCGCLGARSAPASRVHLALNLAAAGTACAAVLRPPHGPTWLATLGAGTAIALVLGIAAATYSAYLALSALPRAWGAYGAERHD
jgi:hypothetical protein